LNAETTAAALVDPKFEAAQAKLDEERRKQEAILAENGVKVNLKDELKMYGRSFADNILTDELKMYGRSFADNILTDDLAGKWKEGTACQAWKGSGPDCKTSKVKPCSTGYKVDCATRRPLLADNSLTCDSDGNCMLRDSLVLC